MSIYSIGYHPALKREDIVRLVQQHEPNAIPIVVDIRATRGARRNKAFDLRKHPGTSRPIGEMIPGCRYVWLEDLGNQSKRLPWVRGPRAVEVLNLLAKTVAGQTETVYRGPIVLLCRCADAAKCHRTEIAEVVANLVFLMTGERLEIVHLEMST